MVNYWFSFYGSLTDDANQHFYFARVKYFVYLKHRYVIRERSKHLVLCIIDDYYYVLYKYFNKDLAFEPPAPSGLQ